MIAVQNVSLVGSGCRFVVALLVDGQLKTYRLAIEPIMVDGKTIERIVCEDGLILLLHIHPVTAQSFFRMVGKVYHGEKIKFPVDLNVGEFDAMA
jgi:hypothetical protein